MVEIISVKFNNKGKSYYFDPSGLTVPAGEDVIVETAKGQEYGRCVYGNHMVEDAAVVQPLRPVVRITTQDDKQMVENARAKEKSAFDYCQKKIAEFNLDMKLVDVECGFDGSKMLFFFTSDGRVDFRELVKDLAAAFRMRIELRQIGVRDEAKMLGGLGVCGKQFCCSPFLSEFHPVSIKMAKMQGLSLNPVKISGTCGRLMCCLKYEETAYEELVKKAPKVDAFVETPSGKGSVVNVNLLRGNCKVRLEEGVDTTLKTFTFGELDILGGKGRRAEYIAARNEGRLEETGIKPSPPSVAPRSGPRGNRAPSPAATASVRDGGTPSDIPTSPPAASRMGTQMQNGDGQGQRRKWNEQRKKSGGAPRDQSHGTDSAPPAAEPRAAANAKPEKAPGPQAGSGSQNKKPYTRRYRGGGKGTPPKAAE